MKQSAIGDHYSNFILSSRETVKASIVLKPTNCTYVSLNNEVSNKCQTLHVKYVSVWIQGQY